MTRETATTLKALLVALTVCFVVFSMASCSKTESDADSKVWQLREQARVEAAKRGELMDITCAERNLDGSAVLLCKEYFQWKSVVQNKEENQ